jgi:hypothetical protein
MVAQAQAYCTHLKCSDLVQHNCLELLIADVPVAQHLVDLSAQLVDVAVTAATAAADRTSMLMLLSNHLATQPPPVMRTKRCNAEAMNA